MQGRQTRGGNMSALMPESSSTMSVLDHPMPARVSSRLFRDASLKSGAAPTREFSLATPLAERPALQGAITRAGCHSSNIERR
jgi:hypothetical protein